MPANTTNYNLVKPIKATENADIDIINSNMDAIDTEMKANADAAAAAQTTASAAIPANQKAAASGVATLDVDIKIPISQIPNMDLAHLPNGILATKLADGSVTDTELEYINSLTSNAQDQITAIKTTADAAATNAALAAHEADYTLQVPYGGATTGPANTYVLAAPAITALSAGMAVSVKFNVDSTGASTLNWNGKGAKGIKKANGTDVTNLKATGIYTLRYDGANFILQGEGGSGNAIAAHLLTGETASTDVGDIVGTMVNNGAGGTVTPGTANQTKAPGFWSSVITILGDIALIAANIMVTKTIFGVAGTATADATAGAGDIANGKTAYINGVKVTGTRVSKRYANGNVTAVSSPNGQLTVTGLAFQPSLLMIYNNGVLSTTTMREYGALANAAGDFNDSFGHSYNSRGTQKNNSNADIMYTADNATFNASGFVFNMQPSQSPFTDTLHYIAFE